MPTLARAGCASPRGDDGSLRVRSRSSRGSTRSSSPASRNARPSASSAAWCSCRPRRRRRDLGLVADRVGEQASVPPRATSEWERSMFDYAGRRQRLWDRMETDEVAALFLPVSADLEYLTGIERQIPFFGQSSYQHGWVSGGLLV